MTPADPDSEFEPRRLGAGQVAIRPAPPLLAAAQQVRAIYRLSDPALSELELEDLLRELLGRVREVLDVDTIAILLYDPEANQLVARAAKGIEEEVEQEVRLPLGQGFAGRIAAERVAIVIRDVDHADILNPILREKGIRSLLGVPLIVEGSLIGVMHVGSLRPRTFDERDVAVLELAAARAAPAIERSRLFSALQREHRVAILLQRSLLPGNLPTGVGYTVAARYLPAREEVGGDWYDVLELPRAKLGIAIGDVVGHGIRAAAMMGQLRTALRAHALEGHGPSETLERVDRFVQSLGEYAMATAAYGLFDPESGKLVMSTAGHPPPIVVRGDEAYALKMEPGAPLGGFPYGHYPETELTLRGDDMLVLYTDGLVERRRTPLNTKIDELIEHVRTAGSPEEACVVALGALVPGEGLGDDAAILALQSAAVPAELDFELPADASVLSHVRRTVRRWLHDRGVEDGTIAEVTLAVNEACANAIEHAYPPSPATFRLDGSIAGNQIEIAVRDSGRWREARGGDRGRGLKIIRAAMDDVAVDSTDAGTVVLMRRRIELP
jgi:anti-sigma regulatory factor (Ser/Thr protein kinase)